MLPPIKGRRKKSLEYSTNGSSVSPTANALESVLSGVPETAWNSDADIKGHDAHASGKKWLTLLKLTFGSVGVVYGDIGTSPLYVISSTFIYGEPRRDDIIGVVSLIIWTLTALLVVKYSLIVLHADDNGQGGTFALFSLLKRQAEEGKAKGDRKLTQYTMGPKKTRTWLRSGEIAGVLSRNVHRANSPSASPTTPHPAMDQPDWKQRLVQAKWLQTTIGIVVAVGVGMILGDGVLTPAMSVVSACEGLQVAIPAVTRTHIIIIAMAILFVLFMIQRFGTGGIGILFSPIILVWFAFLTGIGLYNILTHDWRILLALGPNAWLSFLIRNGHRGWIMLGGVVLCITGAEALYADLGHFSVHSIQLSCLGLTFPAICIAYLGQGAFLLQHPEAYNQAFWKTIPPALFWPVFVVSTGATIVASQAMISASFAIVKQAISQGFFPRFHIYHTSRKHAGQIYIPFVNYTLMSLCLLVVGVFQSSDRIGKSYGIAVLFDMILTTHYMAMVMTLVWKIPIALPILFYAVFAPIEVTYWSATLVKIPEGGWFAVMMACIYAAIMLIWSWGSGKKAAYYARSVLKVEQLLALHEGSDVLNSMTLPQQKLTIKRTHASLQRVRGVGVYYGETAKGVPPVLSQQVSRLPVLFEVNIFLTLRFVPIPEVLPRERLLVEQLGVRGFYHVIARYGYLEKVEQGEAFMSSVLDHVVALLYYAVAHRVDASLALRRAFNIPEDTTFSPSNGHRHQQSHHTQAQERERLGLVPLEVADRWPTNEVGESNRRPDGEVQVDITIPNAPAEAGPGSTSVADVELDPDLTMPPHKRAMLTGILQKIIRSDAPIPVDLKKVRAIAEEVAQIESARARRNIVYVMGKSHPRRTKGENLVTATMKEYFLAMPYLFLLKNFGQDAQRAFGIPYDQVLELGLAYDL